MSALAVQGECLWGWGWAGWQLPQTQPMLTGRNMPNFTLAKKPWHIRSFSFLLAILLKICILIYFCGKIIKQAGETEGKSDTLLAHTSGKSQTSVSALNWIMKLNGYNKRAASNTKKIMFIRPFLFSTMLPLAPDWDVDNVIRYYNDEHEGKSVRDGEKQWTAVLKKKFAGSSCLVQ